MGLPELKNKILMQIENADEATLLKVSSIFDEFNKVENKELTEAIEKARLQIYNNETVSHQLVMEEARAKFPKYFKNEG